MSLVLYIVAMLGLAVILAGMAYFALTRVLGGGKVAMSAVIAVAALFWTIVATQTWMTEYYNERSITCTVTGKDRTSGNKRVYTKNCGTLAVDDTNWRFNRHSADTYGMLVSGQTYRLQVVGARVGLFSWFPNPLTAERVGS